MLPDTFTINGRNYSKDSLAGLVGTVLDDTLDTPVSSRTVFLRVLGGPAQDLVGVPDTGDWIRHRDPAEPEQYLLVIGRNVTDVTYDTWAQVLAEIASLVQDYVIDTTGAPWPQLRVGDRLAVLGPGVIDSDVWWCDHGRPIRRVGELRAP